MADFEEVKQLMKTMGFAGYEFHENTDLYKDLGVDSTEIVDICVKAEKHFGVKLIPDSFCTLGEMVSEINKLRPN
ncbi:MAG TPA: acyl carrier protein [Candidatus Deferrimicrobium sp.]|nr:acyl carrier protein [Candidatus Kapabacteria bacterium]HLP60849.1 acyl carrier protein [Candidatus Deferrimicrobium sp.]